MSVKIVQHPPPHLTKFLSDSEILRATHRVLGRQKSTMGTTGEKSQNLQIQLIGTKNEPSTLTIRCVQELSDEEHPNKVLTYDFDSLSEHPQILDPEALDTPTIKIIKSTDSSPIVYDVWCQLGIAADAEFKKLSVDKNAVRLKINVSIGDKPLQPIYTMPIYNKQPDILGLSLGPTTTLEGRSGEEGTVSVVFPKYPNHPVKKIQLYFVDANCTRVPTQGGISLMTGPVLPPEPDGTVYSTFTYVIPQRSELPHLIEDCATVRVTLREGIYAAYCFRFSDK